MCLVKSKMQKDHVSRATRDNNMNNNIIIIIVVALGLSLSLRTPSLTLVGFMLCTIFERSNFRNNVILLLLL